MKFKVLCLFAALLAVVLPGCSDDDNNKKVKVEHGTTKKVDATTRGLEISFNAEASWSAMVSAEARADVDWLEISPEYGSAGENTISCMLDENTTGRKRVAYVAITCEDETVNVKIEQSAESGGDIDEPNDKMPEVFIEETFTDYETENPVVEKISTVIRYEFRHGCVPVIWESKGEDYTEKVEFDWMDNEVTAHCEMNDINPGTGSVIGVEKSIHKAVLDRDLMMGKGIMRVVSGSYLWDDDGDEETRYSIAYNSENLAQTTTIMEYGEKSLYHFDWSDGNLVKVYRDAGKDYFVNIKYSNEPNVFELLDINWATTGTSDECYFFAGGDPSKIWAAFGYLGRSKNLIQTLEGNPADPNAYTYLTTCKTVSADHVEVEVKEYQTQSAKLTAVRNYDIRLRK